MYASLNGAKDALGDLLQLLESIDRLVDRFRRPQIIGDHYERLELSTQAEDLEGVVLLVHGHSKKRGFWDPR